MKKLLISLVFLASCSAALWYYTQGNRSLKLSYQERNPMMECTFAMIKPDAVKAKNTGKIIDIIEQNDFTILRMHKVMLSKEISEHFYGVHKERPFFGELIEFVTSGPVIIMALQKEDAIKAWRDLMGATNPEEAAEGTIRKLFGANVGNNATHGSDAPETAMQELGLFFPDLFESSQPDQPSDQ